MGLVTGKTPLAMYRELVRLHKEGGLDFSQVTTFNADEFVGLPRQHPQSYHYYMHENFFKFINIPKQKVYLPSGTADNYAAFCAWYERRITECGGIDLQVLGVGTDGHIAFNGPSSSLGSRTRIKTLDRQTMEENRPLFDQAEEVPVYAITMGVGTILEARKLLMLATGSSKAPAVAASDRGTGDRHGDRQRVAASSRRDSGGRPRGSRRVEDAGILRVGSDQDARRTVAPGRSMRNIELKARLADLEAARSIAQRIATARPGVQNQTDTYFYCRHGRLKLRQIEGHESQLVAYSRADQQEAKASDYQLVPVPSPEVLKAALSSTLGVRGVVRKRREVFLYHNVRIHLDEVAGLGTFLEFEAVLGPDVTDAVGHAQLDELARQFGIGEQDLLSGSYGEMVNDEE